MPILDNRLNILIIQNKILHYRKALYNELSNYYDITVIHSGDKSLNNNDKYKEIILDKKDILLFKRQKDLENYISEFDVIVGMFDPLWLDILKTYIICKKLNKPFIWWGIGIGRNKILNMIRIILARYSDGLLLYSKKTEDKFLKYNIKKEKIFIANNTFYIKDRVKCFSYKQKDILLFVGSLDKRKNNEILIQSFIDIQPYINKNIKLIFIGDGVEKEKLKLMAIDVKNIEFKGKITDLEILETYYKRAIVSISLGQAGLSVLQSMGYGVPFLTTRNAISGGEIYNIVHNTNGIILEDIKLLNETLIKLCNNIKQSRILGQEAYDYYTNNATIENMAAGFQKAINYIKNKKC